MWLHSKNKLILFLLMMVIAQVSMAQKITGIWKGYFISNDGDYYRLEFQVQQNDKTNSVTGVSYSYLDKRFYGKATMNGFYFKTNKVVQIEEVRTTEVKSMTGGGTCLMNYKFTYVKSGKEEFLEGTYVAKSEDRKDPKNNGSWGDCGGGKVVLRRAVNSDFYVEPFLRDKPTVKKPAPQTNNTTTKTAPPKTGTTTTKPATKASVKTTTPVTKPPVVTKPKTDTVRKIEPPVVKEEVKKPTPRPTITVPTTTRSRQNELTQTIDIKSKEITVRLYDNGEVDDDTISVYMDNQIVLSGKRLSAAPISLSLKLDNDNPEHVLVMVAENLGRIPPNTSLMIVQDGDKRYQVRITSTNQKNAMVKFRYGGD